MFFLVHSFKDLCDVNITLVRYNTLRVVVKSRLDLNDILLDMSKCFRRKRELLYRLFITLEYLYRVPSLHLTRLIVDRRLLYMSKRMLNESRKYMLSTARAAFCRLYSRLADLFYSRLLKRRHLKHRTLQTLRELFDIYFISVLAKNIHHIYRNDYGDTKLYELRGKIEISLYIRTVDYIKYSVGTLYGKIISCHDLLKRIRRKTVYTGQVYHYRAFVLSQLSFLLFNGNTGPVSNILIKSRKRIKKRCFSTVWIARKGYP